MVDKHAAVKGESARLLILEEHHECRRAYVHKQFEQVIEIVDAFADFTSASNLKSTRLLEMRFLRACALAKTKSPSAAIDDLERTKALYAGAAIPFRMKMGMAYRGLLWRLQEKLGGGRERRLVR